MSGGGSFVTQETSVIATQESNATLMDLAQVGSGIRASINDNICFPSGRPPLYFALRRHTLRPIERLMGQQHRVRVKRRRRIAYLDRKKMVAKAAPVRREVAKTKAKPKKQAAATTET